MNDGLQERQGIAGGESRCWNLVPASLEVWGESGFREREGCGVKEDTLHRRRSLLPAISYSVCKTLDK